MRRLVSLVVVASALVSCGPQRPASSSAIGPAGWSFHVEAGPGARELEVSATFAKGSPEELSVDTGGEPFVRGVEVEEDGRFRPVAAKGSSWFIPQCKSRGCAVRYRFLLADAAGTLDDIDRGMIVGGAILAPPSTWLLRPLYPETSAKVRIEVKTPPGVSFVSGLPRGADGAFHADVNDMPASPYSGFGAFREQRLNVAGATLDVAIAPGRLGLPDAAYLDWIETAARVVAEEYGRFPVERAIILVAPVGGPEVFGKTLGNGGASILLTVGADVSQAALDTDWIMVHELLHLAFPSVAREHLWIEEGLSTYVEPLARARAGKLSEEEVWRGFLLGMPNGLPEADDRGLDRTPTWGRTYWGGAIFCLLADLEIRKTTAGRKSLDDALAAIVGHGGNIAARWPLRDALRIGDEATGTTVLSDLYDRMKDQPAPVDLAALWASLGVRMHGRKVSFDDAAPLSWIRRALTQRRG
jgi:predicted metalloprotease with PDZ domain